MNKELTPEEAIVPAFEYVEGLEYIDNKIDGIGYERIKIDIGDGKCQIGFGVEEREVWDDAAIIEVLEEFLAMMKAPSENINFDHEI